MLERISNNRLSGVGIGAGVTALLASVGANANSKRVALIHFTFNVIGTAFFYSSYLDIQRACR